MLATVNGCLIKAYSQLETIESGQKIARILLADALGRNEAWLWAHPDESITDEARLRFQSLVARAAQQEPLAYLLGYAEFYGRRFEVSPSVLIPRPETEQLVEAVLKHIKNRVVKSGIPSKREESRSTIQPEIGILHSTQDDRDPSMIKNLSATYTLQPTTQTIVDVGTGSGCIAITLAKLLPDATILAVDVSPPALEVAQRNACLHKANNVTFLEGNLLQPLFGALEPRSVDVIVANLPYISDLEYSSLPRNVRDFEPALALKSGSNDPDRLNKMLVEQSKEWLKSGGLLVYETTNGHIVTLET